MTVSIDEIVEIVALQLGRREISPEDRLVEDLGAESVDILNLIVTIESRFDIEIDESEVPTLGTVRDLHQLVARRLST